MIYLIAPNYHYTSPGLIFLEPSVSLHCIENCKRRFSDCGPALMVGQSPLCTALTAGGPASLAVLSL